MLSLTICNTVVPSISRKSSEIDGNNHEHDDHSMRAANDRIQYDAESPDEAALVSASQEYGYKMTARSVDRCVRSA